MIKKKSVSRKFDIAIAKKILDDIKNTFELNMVNLSKLIEDDNKAFAEKNKYEDLTGIINRVINEKWCLDKSSNEKKIDGLGTIGVICNGSLQVFLYMCLKAIKTNNEVLFFETIEIHKTAKFIISMIDKIGKKYGYVVSIKVIEIDNYKSLSDYNDSVDKYILVGDQELFRRAIGGVGKEFTYSAYGTVNLFLDDKSLKDELLKMDDYVFENEIKLNLYKGEDIDKVIDEINESKENFCSVIFSKDINKIKMFVENVNSETVYVNKNPFSDYKFSIDDLKLVKVKKIFL